MTVEEVFSRFDPEIGTIEGCETVNKRLSDLKGLFIDGNAYDAALSRNNPVIYSVSTIKSSQGEGQLHCGLGIIMPGKIGDEYYFTRGHLHLLRNAAEFYIGLKGKGKMILENDSSHESIVVDLVPNSIVYVPRNTAHRTVNIDDTPLAYLGIYPADAGHDYAGVSKNIFRHVVVARNNKPMVMDRKGFLATHQ